MNVSRSTSVCLGACVRVCSLKFNKGNNINESWLEFWEASTSKGKAVGVLLSEWH